MCCVCALVLTVARSRVHTHSFTAPASPCTLVVAGVLSQPLHQALLVEGQDDDGGDDAEGAAGADGGDEEVVGLETVVAQASRGTEISVTGGGLAGCGVDNTVVCVFEQLFFGVWHVQCMYAVGCVWRGAILIGYVCS